MLPSARDGSRKRRSASRRPPRVSSSFENRPAWAQGSVAGFRPGQRVRHPKFGTGVIIEAVNKGESARLTINFGKAGIKELDTAFAKLEAV